MKTASELDRSIDQLDLKATVVLGMMPLASLSGDSSLNYTSG